MAKSNGFGFSFVFEAAPSQVVDVERRRVSAVLDTIAEEEEMDLDSALSPPDSPWGAADPPLEDEMSGVL